MQACYDGLTRLDRVMIMPLDVRDDFALDYARIEAQSMLDRPIDMVFHCQTDGGDSDKDSDDEGEEDYVSPDASHPAGQVSYLVLCFSVACRIDCLCCLSFCPQVQGLV